MSYTQATVKAKLGNTEENTGSGLKCLTQTPCVPRITNIIMALPDGKQRKGLWVCSWGLFRFRVFPGAE